METTTPQNNLVIKVGTETLKENGHLSNRVMADIARGIATLRRDYDCSVCLVSSGAIGAAKSHLPVEVASKLRNRKQALAGLGQTRLMQKWMQHFSEHEIECAQGLVEDHDFESKEGRQNMRRTLREYRELEEIWGRPIIPVINGNDFVTHGPIDSDNDRIAGSIASILRSDLVYLTDVDGLMDRHPRESGARVIREISVSRESFRRCISEDHSENSTGGMGSKYDNAERIALAGQTAYIGNGRTPQAILKIIRREIGTRFYSET